MSEPRVLLPMVLDVTGRTVLVVGAGPIGSRKALDLVAARAKVHVVAPRIEPELMAAQCDSLTIEQRVYEDRDLDGVWLVFVATDDAAVQRRVAEECGECGAVGPCAAQPPKKSYVMTL